MSINLTYPSVLALLQSSILLQKEGARTALLQRQLRALFPNAAAQPLKASGAHTYAVGEKVLRGLGDWVGATAFYLATGVWKE